MIETPVLNRGFVSLENFCADDLSVVNSARVSFNKYHEKMEEGDDKLIGFLMKNHHGTPFEQNFFRFRIKAPIFVFREWHRHRIGISINEWSARYSELKNEFYIPYYDDVRRQIGKPGEYEFIPTSAAEAEVFRNQLDSHCSRSFDLYLQSLKNGIAKEQARFFLPVNIYSEMYWSCNARSLMTFLSLRNSPRAMWEIRQYAEVMEDIFSKCMPITAKYFIEGGRIAP